MNTNTQQNKVRFAVYDTVNHEVLAANYLVPGAAANHAELDYWKPVGLVVVLTVNDIIRGQCDRKGNLFKSQRYKFKRNIWDKEKPQ